jgi:hypothetical protein
LQVLERRDNYRIYTSRIPPRTRRTRRISFHRQGSALFDVYEDDSTLPESLEGSNNDHGYFSVRISSFHDGLGSDDWLLLDHDEEGDHFETAAPLALDDRLSRSEHGHISIPVVSRRSNNDSNSTIFNRQGGKLGPDFLQKEDAVREVLEDRL